MHASGDRPHLEPVSPRLSVGWSSKAVIIGLAASLLLNVLLASKVRRVTATRSARFKEQLLKVGTSVPPIIAHRLGGSQELISYTGSAQPTVLYIFTPPCKWCAQNMDNFKALLAKEEDQYRFIGLSLSEEDLPAYIEKNDLKLAIYSGLSTEAINAYKLGGTPQTIVISSEGKVMQDWAGAYVGDQKSQIEAFFRVTLPGLRELAKEEKATPTTSH